MLPFPARRASGLALVAMALLADVAVSSGLWRARADDVIPLGGPLLTGSGTVAITGPSLPALPATTATSFVVADADTGQVLAAHNAHLRLAPASTLKVLTALTLIPRLDPKQMVVVQPDAPRTDGTKVGVVAGQSYSVGDLFTAMLMMSANDAAVALADANGGLARTLAEMNAQAAWLNARDTVAKTPDGLDAPGQTSSAYDLALMFRAGLGISDFRRYLSLERAQFPAPHGKSYQIQSHDKLLAGYPGMIGGKNGYTVAARASYVGAASRGGHTIIVAVMRDQPNFWDEVKALFDWGFAVDGKGDPVGTLVPAGPLATPSALVASAAPSADASGMGARSRPTSPDRSKNGGGDMLVGGAVAFGATVFLSAVARHVRVRQRRRRRRAHRRYLNGLSQLSRFTDASRRP